MNYTLCYWHKNKLSKVMSSHSKKELQEEIINREGLARTLGIKSFNKVYSIRSNWCGTN
jgi:hypothetical protein